MPLSDLTVRHARPGTRPRKFYDERGLFLLVTPAGRKWWRFKYQFASRENPSPEYSYLSVAYRRLSAAQRVSSNKANPAR